MHHRASSAFWREYQALSQEIRSRADKQFALLKTNPEHPSLQFKKLGGKYGRLASPSTIAP